MMNGTRVANRLAERLYRSMSEFLAIPVLIVAAFLVLALVLYVMDHDAGTAAHWGPVRSYLGRYVGDGASSTGLLTTIAGSLITVTSITFSILLLAVQQGASALTSQIIDHYLRRPSNRVYFGFFVGTSVFALVTLVLTTGQSRPVLGVTFATLFAGVALFALILLIYSTIDQIRPVTIIAAIHDATLSVRNVQGGWIPTTAPAGPMAAGDTPLRSGSNGYLARIRLKDIERLLADHPGAVLTVHVGIGEFVPCGALVASVAGRTVDDGLRAALLRALPIEEQRDIDCDAGYGVDHLVNIGWTTTSTAKSNPAVAVVACHALGDILFRWAEDGGVPAQRGEAVVRYDDRVMRQLIDGLETIVVVASESMQHQTLATVMDAIATAFDRLREADRDRLEGVLLTSLTALGDHLPTRMLAASFERVVAALDRTGREAAARTIADGWTAFAETRGRIMSRGNRAG